ncbi:hypothetical protein DINM_000110 [Dirofilaria immitis]|nr:hypothetical protein [Dirofilaria immitis]
MNGITVFGGISRIVDDFLGLYDTSSSSNEQQQQEEQQLASSTSTTAPTSATVVVAAASSSLLSSPEGNSLKYISDIINNRTTVQQEQQQLLQKLTLDNSEDINDTNAISISYLNACKRLRVDPIQAVQEQIAKDQRKAILPSVVDYANRVLRQFWMLVRCSYPRIMGIKKCFHQVMGVRQECLSLKGHRLSFADMECLEEIFNKVQFDTLDFEYTFLDDDSAVCLGEMLEFYDSAVKLNLSFNKQINLRGWQSICKAIRDAPSMQYLNLRYTSLSDRAIPILARALRSQSSLTILHLENVSLSGRNLILVGNTILRELYLGENNLQPADGAHIYQIITTSASIQLLDLRNNQLQDGGLRHICDALRHRDTMKNSVLSALVLWNNRLTSNGMEALAQALVGFDYIKENSKLETLNIGNNNLLLEGIVKLKPALQQNCSLQRLGLQATNLDCQGAIVLAECLADNKVMIRLDLRDNPHIGSAGLLALHLAMKMNTSLTVLNLDTSVAQNNSLKNIAKSGVSLLSRHERNSLNLSVKEYQEQFKVYYEEIKMFCERNKGIALKNLSVLTTNQDSATQTNVMHNEANTEATKNEGKESEEKNEIKMIKKEHIRSCNLEGAERTGTVKPNNSIWLLGRSSSLTCTETVDDISERVAQMTHHSVALIERVPDSITTIKKQSYESHPTLVIRSELSKCPSLPSITSTDHPETTVNPPVKRISRRFTVSTSSLDAANPRDVARAKSRFKVEQVGPWIQKTATAKSDDRIILHRSLSESFAVDTQGPEFLVMGDSALEVENSTTEQLKELKNFGFRCIDETSESFGSRVDKENEENLPSNSMQFTATFNLRRVSNTAPIQHSDATYVIKCADNIAMKFDIEKCSSCEQTISVKHPTEQLRQEVRTHGENSRTVMKSETAFSCCSAVEDNLVDGDVVKEVVRDLVHYVVYETNDDDSAYYRKISCGITNDDYKILPTIHSLSCVSRSSSSFVPNPSHVAETDEDIVRIVVRSLIRDILLQEKESLRRSLRKKRRHLITISNVDRRSSS